MRLHRVVVFDRRRVGRVDPRWRGGQRRLGIAAAAVGRAGAVAEMLRRVGGAERVLHADLRLGLAVLDADQRGRLLRAFERVGDHDGDMLAVVVDQPVLQEGLGDQ